MSGFLDTQTRANQVETLYIADFNRAADGPGLRYWVNTDTSQPVQVAQSFVVQPEAAGLGIPTDPTNLPAVTAFIQAIYGNLFSHSADAAGLAYWQGQITSGAVSIGAATYIIANGATGADAAVLGFKIRAADFFSANPNGGATATTPLTADFLTRAHNAVAPVVDAATEKASEETTSQIATVALVGQSHDTTHAMHHG
jgi:hypothetical protein